MGIWESGSVEIMINVYLALRNANRQPPTANRQPPTANRQPPTANRQPSTKNILQTHSKRKRITKACGTKIISISNIFCVPVIFRNQIDKDDLFIAKFLHWRSVIGRRIVFADSTNQNIVSQNKTIHP